MSFTKFSELVEALKNKEANFKVDGAKISFDDFPKPKNYIPIDVKYSLADAIRIIIDLDSDWEKDSETKDSALVDQRKSLEIYSVFYLTQKYFNLDSAVEDRTSENIDLMYRTGFIDWMIEEIGTDWARFIEVVNKVCGLELYPIVSILSDIVSPEGMTGLGEISEKLSQFDFSQLANSEVKTLVKGVEKKTS